MHYIWFDEGGFEITEQNLADQVRRIRKKEIITRVGCEEIERKLKEQNGLATAEESSPVAENIEQNGGTIEMRTGMTIETPLIRTNESNHQNPEDNAKVLLSSRKEIMQNNEKQMNPSLRFFDNNKLKDITKRVNDVLGSIETNSISETKNLIIAGITLVYKESGIKGNVQKTKSKQPYWKRRLENGIGKLRKELSKIESWFTGRWKKKNKEVKEKLNRKYKIKERGLKHVMEEIKQRILAKVAKVKRYIQRNQQYNQNKMFASNQKRFYDNISNKSNTRQVDPDPEKAKEFWKS